jgi:hypothetical protein
MAEHFKGSENSNIAENISKEIEKTPAPSVPKSTNVHTDPNAPEPQGKNVSGSESVKGIPQASYRMVYELRKIKAHQK